MKLFYPLFIISTFFLQETVAQDWSLVMPNDTLVYERQDNNQFFTVWVDSTKVNGTDTTYFMNRIFPGDTVSIGNGIVCDTLLATNQFYLRSEREISSIQFCGDKITISSNKNIIYYDQVEFVVFPDLQVGSSWICDSLYMDSMKVISVDTAFLESYQVVDSVKVLAFRGRNMIVSKNHGLVNAFDCRNYDQKLFENVGVQNLQLGTIVPMAKNIYDFDIGDIFYRKSGGGDSDYGSYTTTRTKVLFKKLIGDSIYYTAEITRQDNSYTRTSMGLYIEEWSDIYKYIHVIRYPVGSFDGFLNAFPNTLALDSENQITTTVWVYRNKRDRIEKSNSNFQGYYNLNNICDYDSVLVEYAVDGPNRVYVDGLGLFFENLSYSLSMQHNELIGYEKVNGESWGYTNFTDIAEPDYESDFIFSPNPASTVLNIYNPLISKNVNMEIYGIHGKLIQNGTIDLPYQADVSGYSPGIYFIMISDEKGKVMIRKKIVVQ